MQKIKTGFLAICTFLLSIACVQAAVGGVYNILDYGAVSDTTRLSTRAIQQAVDACAAAGGGRVLVPAGNYLIGTVMLRSGVELHLAAGATLYASRNVADFKLHQQSSGTTDKAETEMLIGATDATNIAVTGLGRLHCRAVREAYQRKPATDIPADSVTGREVANAVRYGVDYRTKYRRVPPSPCAIHFTGCTQVHISDIQVVESAFWSVHLRNCERVFVNGVYITSNPHNGVNSDGLDIDGCRHVMVSNCRIDTGDDALCLKTTRIDGEAYPCRYITITNCILTSSSAALKIGTESHADFEYITVSNCVIDRANRGLNMIVRDGGVVRNVLFSDLLIRTVRKETFWWGNGDPIWFTIQKRGNVPSAGGIEHVVLRNIIAHGQSGIRMEGFSERLKDIRLDGVQLFMEPEDAVDKRSCHGFLFHGVDGLRLEDCEVEWDREHPEPTWGKDFEFRQVVFKTARPVPGYDEESKL